MTADSTGADYPDIVWNYAVHEARQEQLFFWRLGFYPSFISNDVVKAVDEVIAECGVTSVVLYELFGVHDLLLRVWIPASCPVDNFRLALLDRLSKHYLKTCDPFIVNHAVRHWLFPNGSPKKDDVKNLTQSKVEAVEAGRASSAEVTELRHANLVAHFPKNHDSPTDADQSPLPPIKFAVIVVGEPRLGVRQLDQFEETVTEALDEAEGLDQRSLYAGFGFGHFLILGAVRPENFYMIDEELITGLNRAHIQQVYDSRTYTYISGVRRYLRFTEKLSQGDRFEPPLTTESDEASLLPDSQRFELKAKLGEGGFAPVYRVYDRIEQREWAMKVFSPERSEAAEREVRALRRFDDPRIVKVISYHHEISTGRSYLLMEYIEGTALDRYLVTASITDRAALEIVDSLLDALTVIHPDQTAIDEIHAKEEISRDEFDRERMLQERALVHRDIKPANIVLLPDQSIKLIDFNIASPPGELVATRSGTPRYLPPDATSDVWDVSTDLFATGVILYELICSLHPYPNDEPRADRKPIDPRERRPDLPDEFAEFLLKSCMPRRKERFKTAKEMRTALALAAQSLP